MSSFFVVEYADYTTILVQQSRTLFIGVNPLVSAAYGKTSTIKRICMELEEVKIVDLIEYEENARVHNDAQIGQLVKSIKKFGFCAPCLVDDEGVVIAGHGRLMAARQAGLDKVPVVRIKHLSPMQVKAYRVADNQLALNSNWDVGLLGMELSGLKDAGFDLDLLGFDPDISGLTFSPNLDPIMDSAEVSEDGLGNAELNRDQQFQALGSDKASDGIEVICPHCMQSFTFSGS
jgi:hypothetical protein